MENIEISHEVLEEYRAKLVDLLTFGEVNRIPNPVQLGFINWAFMNAVYDIKEQQKNGQSESTPEEPVEV